MSIAQDATARLQKSFCDESPWRPNPPEQPEGPSVPNRPANYQCRDTTGTVYNFCEPKISFPACS